MLAYSIPHEMRREQPPPAAIPSGSLISFLLSPDGDGRNHHWQQSLPVPATGLLVLLFELQQKCYFYDMEKEVRKQVDAAIAKAKGKSF